METRTVGAPPTRPAGDCNIERMLDAPTVAGGLQPSADKANHMTTRTNFPERVKRAALARAGDLCEACAKPHLGKYHFDHVIPDQLNGPAELANCKLLCLACHKEKTRHDVKVIAKAKRNEAAHLRVKADKPRIPNRSKPPRMFTKSGFPPRPLYKDAP